MNKATAEESHTLFCEYPSIHTSIHASQQLIQYFIIMHISPVPSNFGQEAKKQPEENVSLLQGNCAQLHIKASLDTPIQLSSISFWPKHI